MPGARLLVLLACRRRGCASLAVTNVFERNWRGCECCPDHRAHLRRNRLSVGFPVVLRVSFRPWTWNEGCPMRSPVRIAPILWLGLFLAIAATGLAQRSGTSTPSPGTPSDATARIVAAAQALLTTLDDAGRAKVQFPFEGPQKTKWSNLPSPMFQRAGLLLADLTPAQRASVNALLTTALSRDGYRKVTEIMHGDEVLRTGEGAIGQGAGGRGRGRGPAEWRPRIRRKRVLPRLRWDAVGNGRLDVAVWRSSPGNQPDHGGA